MRDRLAKAEKNMEKLRQQRNEYKTAWENTENNLQQQVQEWKNCKFDLQEEITDLKEQILVLNERRLLLEAAELDHSPIEEKSTNLGHSESPDSRIGELERGASGLGRMQIYRSNNNSIISNTEIARLSREGYKSGLALDERSNQLTHPDVVCHPNLELPETNCNTSILSQTEPS